MRYRLKHDQWPGRRLGDIQPGMTPTAPSAFRFRSLKKAVERPSQADRISINQFVATAVAEKVSALEPARLFTDYRARVDFKAFDRIMKRRGGISQKRR